MPGLGPCDSSEIGRASRWPDGEVKSEEREV